MFSQNKEYSLDEFINSIEFGTECEHCGAMSLSKETGFLCVVCSKIVMGRSFRPSTMDKASKNYAGMDNDVPDDSDKRTKTPSPKSARRKKTSAKPCFLPCCTGADSETPEATMAEFKILMDGDGKEVTQSQDDTASKYVRYMRLLFDSGKFGCRSDFFFEGARADAYSVFLSEATFQHENGAKTPVHKLVNNMKWGFEKFVQLADKDLVCTRCDNSRCANKRTRTIDSAFDDSEKNDDAMTLDELMKFIED